MHNFEDNERAVVKLPGHSYGLSNEYEPTLLIEKTIRADTDQKLITYRTVNGNIVESDTSDFNLPPNGFIEFSINF